MAYNSAMARKWIYGLIFLALTGLVVFTSLNTGDTYASAGGQIGRWINEHLFFGALTPTEVKALTGFGGKFIGHFSLFALDGLFLWLFLRQLKWKGFARALALICFGIVIASLGETIQLFVEGRNPSFEDVVINFGGYMLFPMSVSLIKVSHGPDAGNRTSPREGC